MEKFLVIEIQTFENGNISTPAFAYDSREAAESKFHAILSSAAVSKLPIHAAILANNEGYIIENKCYFHESESEITENE